MRPVTIAQESVIRAVLVRALKLARVELLLRNEALTADLLAGRRDVALQTLELDSLASMELCIAIELELGVEIVPFHLHRMKSLDRLVEYLRKRT